MCEVVTRLLNTGTNQPLQTKEWYEDEDTTGRQSRLNTMKPHNINMGSPISCLGVPCCGKSDCMQCSGVTRARRYVSDHASLRTPFSRQQHFI